MPKVVACIVARTVSTRLPLKVLRDVFPHQSMLDFLIQRIKEESTIDEVYICTSDEPVDDIMTDIATRNNVKLYRGSADEVIERLVSVANIENADVIIRITGDNPFCAVEYIGTQIDFMINNDLQYVRVTDLPIGATAEVFTKSALFKCKETMNPTLSEYLMLYLYEPNSFKCGVLKVFNENYSDYSLTVDTPDDFNRTLEILSLLKYNGMIASISFNSIIEIITDDRNNLTAKKIKSGDNVKMPHNKIITYSEFQNDMARRLNNSKILKTYE